LKISRMRSATMMVALILAWNAAPAVGKDLVVHAGTLLDGVGDPPRRQVSILIRDDRVISVEAGFLTPPGAEVIDLSAATVMPGFIDCHVHIGALLPSSTNATEYWVTHSDIDRAMDDVLFRAPDAAAGFHQRARRRRRRRLGVGAQRHRCRQDSGSPTLGIVGTFGSHRGAW